jgi:hypothetical protein
MLLEYISNTILEKKCYLKLKLLHTLIHMIGELKRQFIFY